MENEPLNKGILSRIAPAAIMGAAVGTIIANTDPRVGHPPSQTDHTIQQVVGAKPPAPAVAQKWSTKGLHPELHAIAHIESSMGQNVDHQAHSGGIWTTAFGALGFKPQTGFETYLKDRKLKAQHPDLNQEAFHHKFTNDHDFYNAVASSHWNRLKAKMGGDTAKAAYAWRHGRNAALNNYQEGDPYVQKYLELGSKVTPPKRLAMRKDEAPAVSMDSGYGNNELGRASYGVNSDDVNVSRDTDIFVSFGPDDLKDLFAAKANAGDQGGITSLQSKLDTANEIWKSFCLRVVGTVVSVAGPDAVGRLKIPMESLHEIPALKEQYQSALGGTICLGIGKTLNEADKALVASELRGRGESSLYTEATEQEIKGHQNAELSKAAEEEKERKLDHVVHRKTRNVAAHRQVHWTKRNVGGFHGEGAGFAHPKKPAKPELNKPELEASEHSPGENAKEFIKEHGHKPRNQAAEQLEQAFNQAAAANQEGEGSDEGAETPKNSPEAVKAKVVDILKEIKEQGESLEALKESAPEAYKAVMDLISGIIEMARVIKPTGGGESEELSKTEPEFKDLDIPEAFDYTSLLDQEHIANGYNLIVNHQPGCVATLLHNSVPVCQMHPPKGMEKSEITVDFLVQLLKNEDFLNQVKEAAFLHMPTGVIHPTGPFHDINRLPTEYEEEVYKDGFVTHGGKFVTRAEATAMLKLNRPIQSQELFHAKSLLENPDLRKSILAIPSPDRETGSIVTWHKKIQKLPHYDYSHILPHELQDDGYKIYVIGRNYDNPRGARAVANIVDPYLGSIYGGNVTEDTYTAMSFDPEYRDTAHINIAAMINNVPGQPQVHDPDIVKLFNGKRIGTRMYEALMHHLHSVGIKHLAGGVHSSFAHSSHKQIKELHNTSYDAKPNIIPGYQYKDHEREWMKNGLPPDHYASQADMDKIPKQAFDNKFGDYKYAIKSEAALEKKLPMPSPVVKRPKVPSHARVRILPIGASRQTKETVHTKGGRNQVKVQPYKPDGSKDQPKWVMAQSSVVMGADGAPISPDSKNAGAT